MAKFIKIKKENFASSLNYTADMIIGVDSIALVKKGSNSAINSNEATIALTSFHSEEVLGHDLGAQRRIA